MNALLTNEEISKIVEYTIRKIENYPKRLGKTVENYFDVLFPDEVKNYIVGREINRKGRENYVKNLAAEIA